VRDGRDRMQNDWHEELDSLAREIVVFGRWVEQAIPRIYDIPDHPNYRYQQQRIGEDAV